MRSWRIGIALLALAPIVAPGQIALPNSSSESEGPKDEVGGRNSMDQLRARSDRPSLPLRYGKVKVGSERVTVEGRTLVRERDYAMDYEAGVVYLKTTVRDGSPVTVEYRYDEEQGKAGTFGVGASDGAKGFSSLRLGLTNNTSMVLGLGLTERLGDGTVVSSNVYGLQNSFSFGGGGKLRGLYMVGSRERVQSTSLMGEETAKTDVDEGRATAIVQSMESRALGGSIRVDYRDIGANFSGFQAFEGAGYEAAEIQQMAAEKGLKRTNFQASGLGGPALGLGFGQKSVGDDDGAITWRSYQARLGGIEMDWRNQKVDPGFNRFNDLGEEDKKQLGKERGMERETLSLGKNFAGGNLKFDSLKVLQLDGKGFYRRGAGVETPWMKMSFGDQRVAAGFTRFGDLRENDRDQLSREQGLVRESFGLSINPKNGPLLSYNDASVRTETGDFNAIDLGYKFGRLSLQHTRREADAGFGALNTLSREEIGGHLDAIAQMYDPNARLRNEDWQNWGRAAGLNRSGLRLSYDFGRGTTVQAQQTSVDSQTDALKAQSYQVTTPAFNLAYRDQSETADFDPSQLLFTENQRFGYTRGLDKTDLEASLKLGGSRVLSFNRMSAGDLSGEAARQRFGYSDKGFQLNYARRSVDSGFEGLRGVMDPERDYLLGMMGYDQSELGLAWQILPNLAFDHRQFQGVDVLNEQQKTFSQSNARFALDKATQIVASKSSYVQEGPNETLFDQRKETVSVRRDFGTFGVVTLAEEDQKYTGVQDTAPDSTKQTVLYEGQLTKTTSLRTEHSRTRYETGEEETLTSNSVAQNLTSRTGVSVTNTEIRRDGERPDETRRDYGFWIDFGRNIRLDYKSSRQLVGDALNGSGTLNSNVSITPGQFQGIDMKSMSYTRNGWDDQRDQHIGNVSLANIKPLDWGFLKDVRFHYTADTVHDLDLWQRENRTMGFGGRVGAFAFGYDYRSQAIPSGDRAIDRQFTVTTDTTGKSWIRADIKYNLRTMPMGDQVMVRNYSLTLEPTKGLHVSHQLITNPLQAQPNVLLGDVATPGRSNKWTVAYDGCASTKSSLTFEEFYNEQTHQLRTSLKAGLTLFANNPSPLFLEYGMGESNESGELRRSFGFNVRLDQRPGPNQSFSLRFGNLNWELGRPRDQGIQNWNLRFDYSLRF
ncbi:MAG: hypothetical protein KIT11_00865 [Fimbriimonadaceae bacterium]|nr:hypothetical protein [Fimbriimonadaceae bacterium]QYK55075.1 MAG: hypothetical protein KF733_08670 [Fimbriimonadaceae bacterium]